METLEPKQNIQVSNANQDGADSADYLGMVGGGTLPIIKDIGQHTVQLPKELKQRCSRLSDLCNFVFHNLDAHHQDHEWLEVEPSSHPPMMLQKW